MEGSKKKILVEFAKCDAETLRKLQFMMKTCDYKVEGLPFQNTEGKWYQKFTEK